MEFLEFFPYMASLYLYRTGLIKPKLLPKLIHLAALVCHHHHINNYQGQSQQNCIDRIKKIELNVRLRTCVIHNVMIQMGVCVDVQLIATFIEHIMHWVFYTFLVYTICNAVLQ